MEIETPVVPDATTQIPAPEVAETTEVAPQEPEQTTEPEKQPEDESAKALRRMERRINQKHAQAAAAEERARLVQQELEAARQRLAQYETPQEQPQQQPDPVQLAKVIAQVERVNEKANRVADEGKKRFPDFAQALQEVTREVGPLFDPQRAGLPTPVGEAILDSDDPAALLHHLGKNPDVAAELQGLSPIQVARRIARIETELSKPKEPLVSKAPPAIKPVGANRPGPGELSPDLPLDEWMRRREEQLKGRRL